MQLEHLIRPVVEQLGCELWGIQYLSQGKYSTLRIYIEHPNGVTVEHCQQVSRQIGAVLDVENPISGHYSLEVSSPGIDRQLFTAEQYSRFVGHHIQVKLHTPVQERRNFKGMLEAVSGNEITIHVEGTLHHILIDAIEKAHIIEEYSHEQKNSSSNARHRHRQTNTGDGRLARKRKSGR